MLRSRRKGLRPVSGLFSEPRRTQHDQQFRAWRDWLLVWRVLHKAKGRETTANCVCKIGAKGLSNHNRALGWIGQHGWAILVLGIHPSHPESRLRPADPTSNARCISEVATENLAHKQTSTKFLIDVCSPRVPRLALCVHAARFTALPSEATAGATSV